MRTIAPSSGSRYSWTIPLPSGPRSTEPAAASSAGSSNRRMRAPASPCSRPATNAARVRRGRTWRRRRTAARRAPRPPRARRRAAPARPRSRRSRRSVSCRPPISEFTARKSGTTAFGVRFPRDVCIAPSLTCGSMPGPLDFGPLLVLEAEERARLAAASTTVRFSAGATIVSEGQSADAAFAFTSGRVRVAAGPNGRTLRTLAAPMLVGEMAILSGQPRNASVTAIISCRGLRIPAVALRGAIGASPAFASTLAAFALVREGTHFLGRSSPFADLPSGAIDELAARLQPVRFAAGDELLREGEEGDETYLIRTGEVEIVRGGSSGRVLNALSSGGVGGGRRAPYRVS